MKIKNSEDITDIFFNKTILDLDPNVSNINFSPSEYLFFVKDTSYDGDLNNKLSLIIIDKDTGYVVNNNLKINSIFIVDKTIIIYYIENNKRKEHNYGFK